MEQLRINQNLTNTASILTKAIINLLERQEYMFTITKDQKMADLCRLDHITLDQLLDHLDAMKRLLNIPS